MAGLAGLAGSALWVGAAPTRPNLLVIVADDMGFSDLGCYGSEIPTPHIDRLAAEGLRFRHFYNQGKCEPSRACLLTGSYAQTRGSKSHLTSTLRTAGYFTITCGKVHGIGAGQNDRRFSQDGGADNYWNPGPRRPGEPQPGRKGGVDSGNRDGVNGWTVDGVSHGAGDYSFPAGFYSTDAFADHAVEYLGEVPPDQPFFLYLAFNAPHWPLHARPEDIARHRGRYREGWDVLRQRRLDRQIDQGLLPPETRLGPRDPEVPAWDSLTESARDDRDLRMAIYAAQVEALDAAVGRVLQRVADLGRASNTLTVVLSDNGPDNNLYSWTTDDTQSLGSLATYAAYGEWYTLSATPFRRHKAQSHEGSVRAPCVVHWPGHVPDRLRGGFTDEIGHFADLMPSLLEVAGWSIPATVEGVSLKPVWEGTARPVRPDGLPFQIYETKGVRQGPWKLSTLTARNWELFDLASDPAETIDQSSAEPAVVAALAARWDTWASANRDLFPNEPYDGGSTGQAPVPGGPVTISAVSSAGATLAWPAAQDDSTPSGTLQYRILASLDPGARTAGDFRLSGRVLGSGWATNLRSFTIHSGHALSPGLPYRIAVMVRDAALNEATYPAQDLVLPLSGEAPVVPGPARAEAVEPAEAILSWEPSRDRETPADRLQYGVWKFPGEPAPDIPTLLSRGALVAAPAVGRTGLMAGGLAGGTTWFHILVRDEDRQWSAYPPVAVHLLGRPRSFEDWAARHDLSGAQTAWEDPDGDSLPNLLEYALLGQPRQAEPTETPLVRIVWDVPEGPALVWRIDHRRRDLQFAVEFADAVAPFPWQTAAGPVADGSDRIEEIRWPIPPGSGEARLARLRVRWDPGP